MPGDVDLVTQEGLAFVDALLAWRDLVGVEVVRPAWAHLAWRRLRAPRGRRSAPTEQGYRSAQEWAAAEVAPGASLAWWNDDEEGWQVSSTVALPEHRHAEVHKQLEPLLHRWRTSDASPVGQRDHGGER